MIKKSFLMLLFLLPLAGGDYRQALTSFTLGVDALFKKMPNEALVHFDQSLIECKEIERERFGLVFLNQFSRSVALDLLKRSDEAEKLLVPLYEFTQAMAFVETTKPDWKIINYNSIDETKLGMQLLGSIATSATSEVVRESLLFIADEVIDMNDFSSWHDQVTFKLCRRKPREIAKEILYVIIEVAAAAVVCVDTYCYVKKKLSETEKSIASGS